MKTRTVNSVLAGILALVVLAPGLASAGEGKGSHKLEGAWIATVPGTEAQWSYVMSPHPSGRRASGHGSLEVDFSVEALFGPTDYASPLLVEAEMTGPKTFEFNALWYGIRKLPPGGMMNREISFIGRDWGTLTFVAPNRMAGVHHIECYYPSQDGDGDGIPDKGETPVYSFVLNSVNTRVPGPR